MLTNEQKLFLLFTKCHYNNYKDVDKAIVAKSLRLKREDVYQYHIVNYAINLYSKLLKEGYIEMHEDHSDVILFMKHINITENMKGDKFDLYKYIKTKLEWCNTEGLELESVDEELLGSLETVE